MMGYSIPQIEKMLGSLSIIVDTREQNTDALQRRIEGFGRPFIRKALSYGDYSGQYTTPEGDDVDMSDIAVIERKMNLDEICGNFTHERPRFQREFERAKAAGCHVHLIIEKDNYERLRNGQYRSKLSPQSLIASFLSWSIRYNIQLHFCKPESTGWLIGEIMHYELREHLLYSTITVANE